MADRDNRWRDERWRDEDRDYRREEYGRGYGSRPGDPREEYGRSGFRGRAWGPYPYGGGYPMGPGLFGQDYGRGYDRDRPSYRGDRNFFERAGDEMASWFGSDEAERRRRQDARQGDEGAQHHRGKGPRGYTRSDDRIREDISDRMTDDPYLDASDIDIRSENGEVTLTGTVDTRMAKRHAEDVADDVSGVRHVQNNLRVRQRTDTDVAVERTGTAAAVTSQAGQKR